MPPSLCCLHNHHSTIPSCAAGSDLHSLASRWWVSSFRRTMHGDGYCSPRPTDHGAFFDDHPHSPCPFFSWDGKQDRHNDGVETVDLQRLQRRGRCCRRGAASTTPPKTMAAPMRKNAKLTGTVCQALPKTTIPTTHRHRRPGARRHRHHRPGLPAAAAVEALVVLRSSRQDCGWR